MKTYNTIIIGSGIVGLTLAALLAENNFSVAVVESKTPELNWDENNLTARVSAIHLNSQKVLSHAKTWQLLSEKSYASLRKMTIWDHTQGAHLHFDHNDIDADQMGWIVSNRELIKILWEKLHHNPQVDFYCPNKPIEFNDTVLTLDNNQQLQTHLLIGADGAQSWVRAQMPITLQKRSYQQKAITAVIHCEKPHHHTAYQKFLTTGPIALLPLHDSHHTALVWSADLPVSDVLMQKTQDEFACALSEALDFKLGKLKLISERAQFTLTMQHANDYVSKNCALLGDAAHTIHPLAGLGVNLGIMDAACLTQILIDARDQKKSLGDLRVLRRYSRSRKAENTCIISSMRGLKELFAADTPVLNITRCIGIKTINQCTMVKNQLMQIAMGKMDELPEFLHI